MASSSSSTDFWLLKCKKEIINSSEWQEFLSNLQEKLQEILLKYQIPCFLNLLRTERNILIEMALKNIHPNVTCALHHQISSTLKHVLSEYAINTSTKRNFILSDIIRDLSHVWVASTLKKWPSMKSKMSVFFNRPLQGKLRQLTWSCFLNSNRVFRNEHFKLSSLFENEIHHRCKEILFEINLHSLNNSPVALQAMKTMLQNYCSTQRIQFLTIQEYLLSLPFLLKLSPFPSQNVPPKMLSVLAEEYLVFMTKRPDFMIGSDQEFQIFLGDFVQFLKDKYSTTFQIFSDALECPALECPAQKDSPKANMNFLIEKLTILLKPMIQGMFVAYLNPEALLYVWDQYFICGHVAGLSQQWLQIVAAILLHLVSSFVRLKKDDIGSMFLEKCPLINMSEIQYEVQRNFSSNFQKLEEFSCLPKCCSSSDFDWFSMPLFSFDFPEKKRILEERKNLEMKRYVQENFQKKEEEKKEEIQTIRNFFDQKSEQIKREMENLKKENQKLVLQLKKEKENQSLIKIQTEEKISALNVEISWLQSQFPKLTPKRLTPVRTPVQAPTLSSKNEELNSKIPNSKSSYIKTRQSIVKKFINSYFNKINSSLIPKDSEFLGEDLEEVKSQIESYVDFVKKAEIQVFHRRLRPGEFKQMPADVQQKNSESIFLKIEKEILLENKREKQDTKNN